MDTVRAITKFIAFVLVGVSSSFVHYEMWDWAVFSSLICILLALEAKE